MPKPISIVANMWSGAVIVRNVRVAPSEEELGAIADSLTAANHGVRPVVRTVERVEFTPQQPAFPPQGSDDPDDEYGYSPRPPRKV
jgi:hypothetical protein